jgi:hypothetical protein
MAELKLWYFFEGTDDHGSVAVLRDEYVDDLRQRIYNKGYDSVYKLKDLVLLKVCQNILFLFQPTFSDFF